MEKRKIPTGRDGPVCDLGEIEDAFNKAYRDWYLELSEFEGTLEVEASPSSLFRHLLRHLKRDVTP